MDWKRIRQYVTVAACGILLYWGLEHLELIGSVAGRLIGMVSPFILGAFIAFILRRPLARIESFFIRIGSNKGLGFFKKVSRLLGIFCTFLFFIAVMILVMFLVIPEFVHAVGMLINSLETMLFKLQSQSGEMEFLSPQIVEWIEGLEIDWVSLADSVKGWLISGAGTVLGNTVGAVSAVVSGVTNMFMAVVFCIYLLFQKETLGRQCTKLVYAILPEHRADSLLEIVSLAGTTFSNFFTSQITEAAILGCMFFVSMSLFRFPYALVISVLIAVLALIPIFGAFIGCITGAFLILMVNPMQALGFVVLFLVLQQIEGNLIYPRVVGSSVGLPSIWVLVAVSVGGSAMGIVGMILFIPLFSVFYNLLRRWTSDRIQKKNLTEKLADRQVQSRTESEASKAQDAPPEEQGHNRKNAQRKK